MSLRETDHAPVYDFLRDLEARAIGAGGPASAVAMGSVGYGGGGPTWLDDFRSKRAPVPAELVNAYKSYAYACIQLNMKGVARVPLRLYATTASGQRPPGRGLLDLARPVPTPRLRYLAGLADRMGPSLRRYTRSVHAAAGGDRVDEVVEHPYLEALASPCPHFDGTLLVAYLAACLDAVGSAYLYPVRPSPKVAAREWWPLQAQYVMPMRGTRPGEVLAGYHFFGETFAADELVRIRFISLRDPYLSGYAPMQACYEQLGLVNYYTATVESLLKGGAKLGLVASPAKPELPPGDDERRRFEVDMNNKIAGGGAGRFIATNGAWKFDQYTWAPTDLNGLEITKEQRLVIANCFDTPISLLQMEDSNRAVAESGAYQHQRNAVEPRCVAIASALTHMARQVDPRLFFAFDNPVEEDSEGRVKVFDVQLKNGSRTINEARDEDGLPPVDWGDEPWLANTLTQPSIAAEGREQAAELAEAAPKPDEAEGDDDEPPPEPGKAQEDPDQEDAPDSERSLRRAALDLLGRLAGQLDGQPEPRPGDRDGRADDPRPGQAQGPAAQGGGEHVRPPDWDADREEAGGVPPAAGGGGPGDLAEVAVGPAAEVVPPADGLERPDGGGDDAAAASLLAGGGGEDEGPPGGGDGA